MSHYLVDERDVNFALFDWLKIGELASFPKVAETGFDEAMARETLNTALKIAREVLSPIHQDMDRDGMVFADGKVRVPDYLKKAFKTFCENGFLALPSSPEYGGFGLPHSLSIAAREFFCGANIAFSMYAELTHGAAHIFETFGSEEIKAKYVGNMYTGKWCGTMCLTEPGAGSDVGAIKSKAVLQSDGTYRITGTKIFISSGDHDLTENIIHPVLARVEGAPTGVQGVSLFLVPKILVNDDGSLGAANDVVTGNIEHKMGIKGNATCTLNFGENNNCAGWLVGEENKGIVYMFQMMNEARIHVGVQGQAIAGAAYRNALKYAKERIQFRHVKDIKNADAPAVAIVEHPDVRRMLMQMKSTTEGLRALLYKTAHYGDLAKNTEDENERTKYTDLMDLLVPICKAYASDQGFKVTELAMQTYGGYGYCSEYPMEQYMRDCKITSIYEGTNGIQALDLVGRKLAMKGGRLIMQYMQELAAFVGANKDHPVIGDLVKELEKVQMEMAGFVMGLRATVKAGGLQALGPILNATPFLEAMGHITLSWFLQDQAVLAHSKLKDLLRDKGVESSDRAAFREFVADNDEARFLYGKVQSAAWFTSNMLPHATAIFNAIKTKDLSALKVIF